LSQNSHGNKKENTQTNFWRSDANVAQFPGPPVTALQGRAGGLGSICALAFLVVFDVWRPKDIDQDSPRLSMLTMLARLARSTAETIETNSSLHLVASLSQNSHANKNKTHKPVSGAVVRTWRNSRFAVPKVFLEKHICKIGIWDTTRFVGMVVLYSFCGRDSFNPV